MNESIRTMKNTLKQLSLALAMAGLVGTTAHAQIQVESGLTLEQYVNDVLLGGTGTASNITYLGGASQIGYLTGAEEGFGFESGLVMSCDVAENVSCPSDLLFCDECLGNSFYDADLLAVANSVPPLIGESFSVNSVNDGCVLEFDFVAGSDGLSLEFIFGSDEYETYINTQYNDVFACFLSGPGVAGPYMSPAGFPNGAKNIAIVPGSDPELPITISSVNPSLNDSLYVSNQGGVNPCINGYTLPITAEHELICGETYHMKLAIADGSDTGLESVLIIREGSFDAGSFEIETSLSIDVGGGNGSVLYEDCGAAELIIARTEESDWSEDIIVNLTASGAAVNGVDYGQPQADGSLLPLPDVVYIDGGVDAMVFQIAAAIDGMDEGDESVVLTFEYDSPCLGSVSTSELNFTLGEEPPVLSVVGFETVVCPGEEVAVAPTVTGGYGNYVYDWSCPEGAGQSNFTVFPLEDWSCTLQVSDTCGLVSNPASVDMVIDVLEFPPVNCEIDQEGPVIMGCNNYITISATSTGGDGSYQFIWTDNNGNTLSGSESFTFYSDPSISEIFVTAISACGFSDTDSIAVEYQPAPLELEVQQQWDVQCGEQVILEASASGVGPFTFTWSDENGFVLGVGPTLTWTANGDEEFFVTVANDCNQIVTAVVALSANCEDSMEMCAYEDYGEEGINIPDDQSSCLVLSTLVESNSEGQGTIMDVDSLVLFVNMEHSYMGDLSITYTCPNGQSVDVQQQAGGGTNIGIPDQGDGTGPGIGWDYYWTATNSNGTWVENEGGSLPAGTYESSESMTALIGCPINGEWSIQICDSWAIDDGYIFEWGIDFGNCEGSTGCADEEACNFDPSAVFDDGSCVYPGCTDAASCNYDPEAGCDDGSCLPFDALAGCMDQSACNYNPNAVCPDDSCIYPLIGNDCEAGAVACDETTTWNVELQRCECSAGPGLNDCPSDLNSNGLVEVTDLLVLLGDFGLECEE